MAKKPNHHARLTPQGKKGHALRGRRKGQKNRYYENLADQPKPPQGGSPYKDLGPPKRWVFDGENHDNA